MGTRNVTIVIKDGEYMLGQYCQWDGYPEGQGATVLDFLKNKMDRKKFEAQLENARFGTDEELHALWVELGADDSGLVSMDISDEFKKKHPQLHRDMGATVLEFIQNADSEVLLANQVDFAKDGLFCEWTYVIDLDNNALEVYGGYNNQAVPGTSRFSADMVEEGSDPIMANAVFDFANLPDEALFVKLLSEAEDGLTEDDASYVLSVIRNKMGQHLDNEDNLETVERICNYMDANMDDFLETINC
jgi:hypothetical protein